MKRVIGALMLFVLFITGATSCSFGESKKQPDPTPRPQLVPGYKGGCPKGLVLYAQNQFDPRGARWQKQLKLPREVDRFKANVKLTAVGWTRVPGSARFPYDPPRAKGRVAYYVAEHGGVWVFDRDVRTGRTVGAPYLNNKFYKKLVKPPPRCKLTPG
jgi:hypothetical protein